MSYTVDDVVLPDWVLGLIPERPVEEVVARFEWDESENVVEVFVNNILVESFGSPVDAYDAFKHSDENYSIVFGDSFMSMPGMKYRTDYDDSPVHGNFLLYNIGDGFCAVFSERSYDISLNKLKGEFADFYELNEAFLGDPDNWALAYDWLNSHPVFWTHRDGFVFETGQAVNKFVVDVSCDFSVDGECVPVVYFESGKHILPDCEDLYHDYRLDVKGSSFEECFLKLARKVSERYDSSGVERA